MLGSEPNTRLLTLCRRRIRNDAPATTATTAVAPAANTAALNTHAVLSARLTVPDGHTSHTVAPAALAAVPSAHNIHFELAGSLLNVPAGQSAHVVLAALLNVPAPQAEHSWLPGLAYPG